MDVRDEAEEGGGENAVLIAMGWVVVRSSRQVYAEVEDIHRLDVLDSEVDKADRRLFAALQAYLRPFEPPALAWQFLPQLNNHTGILQLASSRNHRGETPLAVEVLEWIASNGPGSYGLVYIHDDEDAGDGARSRGRSGVDHTNEFRVWRLLDGKVEELDDPFLSPIVPRINPSFYA